MYIRNRVGPNKDPWAIPDLTIFQLEEEFTTNCTLTAFRPPLETFENHRMRISFSGTETGAFAIHWI